MQVVLKVMFKVVEVFLVLDFDDSLIAFFVDWLDLKLAVWTEDELLIVPEIRIEHWVSLVHCVDLQL